MRLIDAEALEEEIVKTQRYVPKDAVLDVACMVNRAPTIEAKQAEWISVKDRLPEDNKYVLAWSPRYNEVVIAWYCKEEDFWRTEDDFAPFPSHWQPLPEPPKGE